MKEEQPNFDIMENVKQYLKDNLRVQLDRDYYAGEGPNLVVKIILEKKLISKDGIKV
jgi:hypothetical protein